MNLFSWFSNSQSSGNRQPAAAHDLGEIQRRPVDVAYRRVPQAATLDLADPGGDSALRDRADCPPIDRDDDARGPASRSCKRCVDLEAAMLETWYNVQESNAESLANNVDVRQSIYPLLDAPMGDAKDADESVATLRAKLDKVARPVADGPRLLRLHRGRQEETDRGVRATRADRPGGRAGIRRVPDPRP